MLERWINKKEETEKALEKVDLGNGVIFERSNFDGRFELKLTKEGSEVFDLMSLAPEGTKLNFTGKWSANRIENGFEIGIGNFTQVSDLVIFLHEAGHLKNPEDIDLRTTLRNQYIRETKKDKLNRYPASRLRPIKEEIDVVLRSERDAWAFALRQSRNLEKEFGINILDRISGDGGTLDRVRNFINECVNSYEIQYLDELYYADIFSREQLEKHLAFLEEQESQAKQ